MKQENQMIFDAIHAAIEDTGLTQREICRQAGLSADYLSQRLANLKIDRSFTVESMRALRGVMGTLEERLTAAGWNVPASRPRSATSITPTRNLAVLKARREQVWMELVNLDRQIKELEEPAPVTKFVPRPLWKVS